MYLNNISITNICNYFHIHRSSIYYILKKYNINCRGEYDKNRIHFFNYDKMEKDSHNKYYWIGFLAADGNVSNNYNEVSIELGKKDKKHLEKIKKFFESDAPIVDRINNNGSECSKVNFCSKKFAKYLSKYNIIPNKSLMYKIPLNEIPQDYIYDYIRGIFDGDGSLSIHNNLLVFSFCSGNKECVCQIANILQIFNKIDYSSGVYRITTAGKKAKEVLEKIYQNSTEENRLDRKYSIYKTLI